MLRPYCARYNAPHPAYQKLLKSIAAVGDRVFLTCSSSVRQDRLLVMAFDAKNGQTIWKREFWATRRTLTHPSSAVAAPTPASDGQRILAFYSSNDLVGLDVDGNLEWYRGLAFDYPKAVIATADVITCIILWRFSLR